MRTRRTVGAVLTLSALTLSLAETVWASTCAPMAMGPVAAAVEHGAQPRPDCPGQTRGERDEADPGSHCPFSPVVSQSCVSAASLPTYASFAPAPSLQVTIVEPSSARAVETWIGAALFRPPRA